LSVIEHFRVGAAVGWRRPNLTLYG